MLCGSSDVGDFNELKRITKYLGGFDDGTFVVKWFWEIVLNYPETMKRKLLLFENCTTTNYNNCEMIIFDMFVKIEKENDYHWAQYRLGRYYKHGKGIAKDVKKAFEYYFLSSEQGNSYAMFRLGFC